MIPLGFERLFRDYVELIGSDDVGEMFIGSLCAIIYNQIERWGIEKAMGCLKSQVWKFVIFQIENFRYNFRPNI